MIYVTSDNNRKETYLAFP